MNRTMSRLIASVLCVSSAFAASSTETNVTYVNMRDYRNRAEMATHFRSALELPKADRIGGCVELVPFYRHSYHKSTWGKGLGVSSSNVVEFGNGAAFEAAGKVNHDRLAGAAVDATGKITLNPEHYAIGANICYSQCLSELWEGLFFDVNTAIVQDNRRDNLESTLTGANAAAVLGYVKTGTTTGTKLGRYSESSWQSKAGVEDPEIRLGYKFFDEEKGNVSINIGGSLPTGTSPKCELVNEPLVGSKHFRLGAGVMACAKLWDDEDKSLKLFVDANYRYAFESKYTAIPQLKKDSLYWGHLYRITNAAGDAITDDNLAGYYGGDAKVGPGSEFDGYAMADFCWSNFDFNLGYQIKWRNSHEIKPDAAFTTRYIADADGAVDANKVELTAKDLDWKRESMLLHRIFAGAGAVMKDWEYPCLFGIGGTVDIANKKQITPENWEIFAKAGICF